MTEKETKPLVKIYSAKNMKTSGSLKYFTFLPDHTASSDIRQYSYCQTIYEIQTSKTPSLSYMLPCRDV